MTATTPASRNVGTETPEALEIGVGCLAQSGEGYCYEAAAEQLVGQFLTEVHPELLPVRGILLLATADWCRTDEPLCRKVRKEIHRRLGYGVPLIGGSMAKLYCSKAPKFVMEHGVVLVALCSQDFWMTAMLLERPHKSPDGRRQEVKKFAKELEVKAGVRLGSSVSRHLLGFFPGIFRDERGQSHYWDHELHEEILRAFAYDYPLVGGAAANALDPTLGYQFADDNCCESGLALAIVESDLAWGTRMGHGFVANRKFCVAVDALNGGTESGYEVETLDGKPAAERLRELQATHRTAGGSVLFGVANGEDYQVIRAFDFPPDELGNRVRLTRRVRKGDRLYVLSAERERLDGTAQSIIEGAVESAEATPATMKLLWGMSCTGRPSILDALQIGWEERIQKLAIVYPCAPMVGGLCGGEFGIDQWGRAQANTFSCWANCIASVRPKRSKNRDLQRELIKAAGRLSRCTSPTEVMETALGEAIQAGALGGQVCLVDRKIGKIIGRKVGCALSATDQPPEVAQDWEKVAHETLRDIPKQVGGQFPLNLLNYAMRIDLRVPVEMSVSIPQEEDILTLITRTRCAVLVTDAERLVDPKD